MRDIPDSDRFTADDLALGWLLGVSVLATRNAHATHLHSHSCLEVICCLKGEFAYAVDLRSPVLLKAGMGIVVPPRLQHPLAGDVAAPGLRVVLHLNPRPKDEDFRHSAFTPKDYRKIRNRLQRTGGRPFRLGPLLTAQLKEIAATLTGGTEKDDALACAHVRLLSGEVLLQIARQIECPASTQEPLLMSEAVRFLEEHHAGRPSLDALVRHMGYSRTQLFSLFRRHTGLTPHEYLVRYRVRKAEELLQTTNEPVHAIARRVGFSDYIRFSTVFKRYTSRTASSFRPHDRA